MNIADFKKLKVGDVVSHPATGPVKITHTEQDYDYSTRPPTPYTWGIYAKDGRNLRIGDSDIDKLEKV